MRKQLLSVRPKPRERAAAAKQCEPQPAAAQPLRHVPTVDEPELEHPARTATPDRERPRIETAHDPAPDPEVDDHADPELDPDLTHAERPRGEKDECRMVSR